MKITVFTSNQPRHLSLVKKLSKVASKCYAILESNTLFPGQQKDFFEKSEIMQKYFNKVQDAEKKLFGSTSFLDSNTKIIPARMGDLNKLSKENLKEALDSDIYIVFGSSYIKGWLVDFLVNKRAINIHMGISPYYRGSSCNFWAAYEENFHLIGATVHLLSKGLDSGDIIYHCVPSIDNCINCFEFSMQAVQVVHDSIIENIKSLKFHEFKTFKQMKEKEIRYTKNIEFTDEVAKRFLDKEPSMEYLKNKLQVGYDESLYYKI